MFDTPDDMTEYLTRALLDDWRDQQGRKRWYQVFYVAAKDFMAEGLPDASIWGGLEEYLDGDPPEPGYTTREELHDMARDATRDALAGRPSHQPELDGLTIPELLGGSAS